MAGASVTLMKLTGELKRFLDHPCETPALKVGETAPPPAAEAPRQARRSVASTEAAHGAADLGVQECQEGVTLAAWQSETASQFERASA